ncbi:molecular chaperone Hsp33 [Oenococcus oeni]|uniref:Hsp33 family molecular chaperone HslO n=1 Tax=Oenococcus oeni TaxID=1247 RepID=UPI0008F7EADB|nr:Hsp33 family molecular chaperone HslO [Oenococcus oeni]OIL00361.1 molecular chaperone Hsp33 [Oenococcus oeni]
MDYLAKSITKNGHFRAYVADASNVVKQMTEMHKMSPDVTVAFGRTLIATALVGSSLLKEDDQMHISINGRGPIGQIVTETNSKSELRGYVTNPKAIAKTNTNGEADISNLVGLNGTLRVTKVHPGLDPYTGEVKLVTGQIGDDFTYYLAQSEQIPSAVGVSVFVDSKGLVKSAGGFLLQTLPGANDTELDLLEQHLRKMPNISSMLAEGLSANQILAQLFANLKVDILETIPLKTADELPKKWYADAIGTLPKKEIQAMIDEDHGAEIVSRFTEKKYNFSKEELKKILALKMDKKLDEE